MSKDKTEKKRKSKREDRDSFEIDDTGEIMKEKNEDLSLDEVVIKRKERKTKEESTSAKSSTNESPEKSVSVCQPYGSRETI